MSGTVPFKFDDLPETAKGNPFDQFDAPNPANAPASQEPDLQERARRYANRNFRPDPTDKVQYYWTKPPRRGIIDRFMDSVKEGAHKSPAGLLARFFEQNVASRDANLAAELPTMTPEQRRQAAAGQVARKERDTRTVMDRRNAADPAWRKYDPYDYLND